MTEHSSHASPADSPPSMAKSEGSVTSWRAATTDAQGPLANTGADERCSIEEPLPSQPRRVRGSPRVSRGALASLVPSPRWSIDGSCRSEDTGSPSRTTRLPERPQREPPECPLASRSRTGELHYRHAPSIYASCQGVMFWLSRKVLSGSYLRLSWARRS